MASITKMNEKLKELEARIEEQKKISEQYLGEAVIDVLKIDYELLSTKKECREIAETILNNLNNNPFSTENNENKTENNGFDINEQSDY